MYPQVIYDKELCLNTSLKNTFDEYIDLKFLVVRGKCIIIKLADISLSLWYKNCSFIDHLMAS